MQTLGELQRRSIDIQGKKASLKGQHATMSMERSSAETTLRYLQDQKEEAVVYYAVGRMCVLFSLKGIFFGFHHFPHFLTRVVLVADDFRG